MAQDLLTTYKYGWKTSYYQNTYDAKKDEDDLDIKESNSGLDQLMKQLEESEEDCESCKI